MLKKLSEFGNYKNKTNVGEHELYFFDTDSYLEDNLDYIILECMDHSKLGKIIVKNDNYLTKNSTSVLGGNKVKKKEPD